MGKNHRYKKKLKSEKAKVHISSKTKFLPKGQNVTNTAFKIKPIVIQEQLHKKDKNALLSRRKLSINELISKLKHYNDSVKMEACLELKQMIKEYSLSSMENSLSIIIQTASILIQDRDRKVRKASIKLLNEILENGSVLKLKPFFNYILTNLKCAMTNIDRNIQEDCLLLLDSLLMHIPTLVAENFEKIFPDFLTLISKLKGTSLIDKTLTMNLGSKLTSVKWRIKVLIRLYGILKTIIVETDQINFDNNINNGFFPKSCFVPIYKKWNCYETSSINFLGNSHNQHHFNNEILNRHVASLIPLLYETWLEVVPEKKSKNIITEETTVLNEESAAILKCILNIMYLLHKYREISGSIDIFTSKDGKLFVDNLLLNFPYNCNKGKNPELSQELPEIQSHCTEENLLICYLFFALKTHLNSKNCKLIPNSISIYLHKCLGLQSHLLSANSTKYFIFILKEIILINPKLWHKLGFNIREIWENVIDFYEEKEETIDKKFRNEMLEMLTFLNYSFKSEKHEEWLGKLPNYLCQHQVSVKIIDIILNLCKRNHELVKNNFLKVYGKILENLPSIEIVDAANVEIAKRNIVYIFFYLNLDEMVLRDIYNFIETHKSLSISKYFQNMLELRL